jgi:hypothetical protein
MAVIDLRSVTLWVTDGTVSAIVPGAVNLVAGYPAVLPFTTSATSTIVVDTFAVKVPVGSYVRFGTHMQFYEVLASTPTTGATTGLTIYPALLSAQADDAVINVIGNGIYAKLGEGNLTYSEKRNLIYVRDRGYIDTMKVGDDEPIDVSLDFTWEFLRSAGAGFVPTIEEAVKQVGQAATWVSTSADPCEPYSVNVWLLDIPPCGTDAESIQLPEFRWTSLDHDLKGGKVSVKASCNALYAIINHTTP